MKGAPRCVWKLISCHVPTRRLSAAWEGVTWKGTGRLPLLLYPSIWLHPDTVNLESSELVWEADEPDQSREIFMALQTFNAAVVIVG